MKNNGLVCPACSSENIEKSVRERPAWGYNGDELTWWNCLNPDCQLNFAQGDWWPEAHEQISESEWESEIEESKTE